MIKLQIRPRIAAGVRYLVGTLTFDGAGPQQADCVDFVYNPSPHASFPGGVDLIVRDGGGWSVQRLDADDRARDGGEGKLQGLADSQTLADVVRLAERLAGMSNEQRHALHSAVCTVPVDGDAASTLSIMRDALIATAARALIEAIELDRRP